MLDALVATLFWIYATLVVIWLLASQFMDWSTPVKESKMSETRPVYISCASNNNSFTDCLVRRSGSLMELVGHPQMQFAPAQIRELIAQAQKILEEIER